MRHKWKDITVLKGVSKVHECIKCGITRTWLYNPYQCWQYSWVETYKAQNGDNGHSIKESFKRPECKK